MDFIPAGRAQYTIMLEDDRTRDRVREALKEHGIPSMIYYPRGIHQQEAYQAMCFSDEWYPNTIQATKTVLSLPIHPYLKEEDADRICKVIIDNV